MSEKKYNDFNIIYSNKTPIIITTCNIIDDIVKEASDELEKCRKSSISMVPCYFHKERIVNAMMNNITLKCYSH